jgi:archaeal flagellin FlaB
MGKICKKLKENEIGSIGIGAMIVFIAMVLVAGIAASVLIQTSTKLESQAMRSGQDTIAEVSTGIAVEEIEGHKSGTTLNYMVISVRPRAGSSDVDLSEAVVELSDSSTKNLLTYDSGTFTDTSGINGDIFAAGNFISSAVQFGLIVLEDADGSCTYLNPVINRGDHVLITINASSAFGGGGLATRTDIFGLVIPEEGSPGVISFTTPAAYPDTVVGLQ